MGWEYEILEDPTKDYELPRWYSYDYEIEKPIPANFGIGIIFRVNGKGKYETVGNHFEDDKRIVNFEIKTWRGCGDSNAVHYYGKFKVRSCNRKVLEIPDGKTYYKVGDVSGTNVIPKKCSHIEFEVTRIMKKDYYSRSFLSGEKQVRAKKGERFYGFDDLDSLKEAMKREFKRIFGDGWVLKGRDVYGETVDEEFESWKKGDY